MMAKYTMPQYAFFIYALVALLTTYSAFMMRPELEEPIHRDEVEKTQDKIEMGPDSEG